MLRTIARATWKKLDRPVQAKDAEVTVYWHILTMQENKAIGYLQSIDLWQTKTIDSRQESKLHCVKEAGAMTAEGVENPPDLDPLEVIGGKTRLKL